VLQQPFGAEEIQVASAQDQVSCLLGPLFRYSWPCSCLAHVINLATQALIRTYSKSPHFDPKCPKDHVPADRDEVGLVRSIVVKERSLAKRKEMWRTIQIKADVKRPMQLVLDMKVRWSSTYVMLHRAESLKEVTAAA
jgi:hypothetical protein